MVATIVLVVLVVSNKPIQSSMNNTSSNSKVTMRVDRTALLWMTNSWRMAHHGIQVRKYLNIGEKERRVTFTVEKY